MSTLEKAIAMAAQAHAGQRDKEDLCYILHPLRVMMRVQGEEAQMVAVLHDTLRKERVGRHLRAAAAVGLGRLQVDNAAVLADLFALLDSGEERGAEALCQVGPAALPGADRTTTAGVGADA